MKEPEEKEVSIPLDGETAGEVSRLAREFGVESDSAMLKWMVDQGQRGLDHLLYLRADLARVLGDYFDGREEIRLRVSVGELQISRGTHFSGGGKFSWDTEVRAVPAFPEPALLGRTLDPEDLGYKSLACFAVASVKSRIRSPEPDELTVFLEYLDGPTKTRDSVCLVFERLSGDQLDEILSGTGREFDLVRRADELVSLPVSLTRNSLFPGGPPGRDTPATRARVLPPDPAGDS